MSDTERLYRTAAELRRDAGAAYHARRITLRDAEIKRETDAEIRAALAQIGITARLNNHA